jgi:hypothetical protein
MTITTVIPADRPPGGAGAPLAGNPHDGHAVPSDSTS